MSGCPLFKSTNKYIRVVVSGYASYLVIANIFFAVRYLYFGEISGSSSMSLLLLYKVWDFAYSTFAVSTILIIWSSRKGFLRILNKISTLLSNADKKRLHYLSLVLFIYKTLFMLVFQIPYFWSLYGTLLRSWREDWQSYLLSVGYLTFQLHDWELIIISLFITLLKAIHLAETNVMNILDRDLKTTEPKVLYRQLHNILSFKEHLIECVSFLPVFLYCYIFIKSVGCIVQLHFLMDSSSVLKGKKIATILLNTKYIVTVCHSVLLTLYTDHLSCQSRSQLRKMEYQINTKYDHLLKRNVIKIIEESKIYEYRAANFFVMNRGLLLSFFSAFITFTVLFVQLINQ